MSTVIGVDGCRAGWILIARDLGSGALHDRIAPHVSDWSTLRPVPSVIAVDIPIGFTDSGGRLCDKLARRMLGRVRQSSVFPAPIRPALSARSREEASLVTHDMDGRRVSAQAWGIYDKIRQVDTLLCGSAKFRGIVTEVHPEVTFSAWNNAQPMIFSKKTADGRNDRRALIDRYFGRSAYDRVRNNYRVKDVAHDDILDAFAALWTAERIARGESQVLGDRSVLDQAGLPMTITY